MNILDLEEFEILEKYKSEEYYKFVVKAKDEPMFCTKRAPIETFYDETDGEDYYDEGYTYTCPNCKDEEVGRYSNNTEEWLYEVKYCSNCGQKIKWD